MAISVFISYASETAEHNKKVLNFANKLRAEGIDVLIYNDIKLGERLPVFMEKIEDSDFTLMICTPAYRERSKTRAGGVGYEYNIVTSSVACNSDDRKFIPVLFSGDWNNSVPAWARGKVGIDYRKESSTEFQKLIDNFLDYESSKDCKMINNKKATNSTSNFDISSFRDKKTMTIIDKNGTTDIVEVLLGFRFKDNNREYVVYTKNETDCCGNVTIYVSQVIIDSRGKEVLSGIEDEFEWIKIRAVLDELSKEEN